MHNRLLIILLLICKILLQPQSAVVKNQKLQCTRRNRHFPDWLKHAKDGMKALAVAAVAADAAVKAAVAAAKATKDALDEEKRIYSSSANTSDNEIY